MDREQLSHVVERATWAPSIHNTQPWRFVIGTDTLDLYADPQRAVPVVDPSGRQLVISCGAALLHARLGVRELGYGYGVDPLPSPDDPSHLARVRVGDPAPASADERALLAAMEKRHTHREPFDPRPVPATLVDELRRGVAAERAWLHAIERAEDLVQTAVLLSHADEAEMEDPAYQEELRAWTRTEEGATDGVPATALPTAGAGRGRRASTMVLRDFAQSGRTEADEAGEPEHPLVVVLGTPGDDRRSWLDAGQALGWLLLRAAADDVYASPLNQVLDLPVTRRLLARDLRLVGYPQMLLRMGYGRPGHPAPRRPVSDVLG